MARKLTLMFLIGVISLLGVVPALAYENYHWATPTEYKKATGKKITKFNEAPMLRTMVAAGEIPPVEERLPEEPLVIAPAGGGEIGKYGGIRYSAGGHSWFNATNLGGLAVAEHSWTYRTYPSVVKGWEIKEEGKVWIIHLRKGLKWSDGYPYTADDLIFWWEDIANGEKWSAGELGGADWLTKSLMATGALKKVEKIDDYTVKFYFSEPSRILLNIDAEIYIGRYCKHYLQQFHPKYQDKATLDKLIKEGGFNTWGELFMYKFNPDHNPDKPTMTPWIPVEVAPSDPVIWKRNPYYFVVDTEGNQLPYIDEIRHYGSLDSEVVNMKALAGELDYVYIPMNLFPLAKKAEQAGKIKVYRWQTTEPNSVVLNYNLTCKDLTRRKIYQDKRFRIASSYAINREMINQTVFMGMCDPWQVAPYEDSPYYNERLAHEYLEYNPAKADKLLDEIGLDKRDSDGFRLLPNGKKLLISILTTDEVAKAAEIIAENLEAVGLRVNMRVTTGTLIRERRAANDLDAVVYTAWGLNEGAYLDGFNATHFVPVHGAAVWYAPLWNQWYLSKGERGEKPVPDMVKAIEYYKKACATSFDLEESRKWFMKVLDIAADNLWTIGTVKKYPWFYVTSPNLKNFPSVTKPWTRGGDCGRPDLWFFEK